MRAGIYGTEPGRVRAIYATGAIYGSCRVSGGALSLSARDEELRRAFCAGYSPTRYFSYFIYYNRQTCVCQTKKRQKKNKICAPPKLCAPAAVRSPSSARRRYTGAAVASRRPSPQIRTAPTCSAAAANHARLSAPCRGKLVQKNLLLPQSTHKRQARRPKTGRRAALSVFLRFSQYPRQITPPAAPAGLSAQKSISGQSPAAKKPRASKRRPISSSTASLSAEIVW